MKIECLSLIVLVVRSQDIDYNPKKAYVANIQKNYKVNEVRESLSIFNYELTRWSLDLSQILGDHGKIINSLKDFSTQLLQPLHLWNTTLSEKITSIKISMDYLQHIFGLKEKLCSHNSQDNRCTDKLVDWAKSELRNYKDNMIEVANCVSKSSGFFNKLSEEIEQIKNNIVDKIFTSIANHACCADPYNKRCTKSNQTYETTEEHQGEDDLSSEAPPEYSH